MSGEVGQMLLFLFFTIHSDSLCHYTKVIHHLCRFFSVVKTYFLYSSQILLSGVELNKDNNVFLLDEELASMRKGREFLSQINDGIPRTLISTELMIKTQEARRKSPLTRDQFENQVLSMVYSALQVGVQRNKEDKAFCFRLLKVPQKNVPPF
uniref:Uncharacterized protein n=1 Tax=Xiphophorus couchianus TaxID=32473 RepID=A0A3B5L4K2_9TELE